MAFQHGKSLKVLVNAVDLSAYFHDSTMAAKQQAAETTTYGKSAKTYVPGLLEGTLAIKGLFDGAASAVDQTLSILLGASSDNCISLALEGSFAIGKRVAAAANILTDYEVLAPVADVVKVSLTAQADGGIKTGVSLHDNAAAESETGSAVNSTGTLDTNRTTGQTTANGAVALLHVTAVTGTPATVVKVQSSDDNVTYADITGLTFTSTSVTGFQALTIPPGAVISRYVRVTATGTNTTTITYAVSFLRL